MSKKVSAAGIVLLFIFSVITPLVVGYDVEIDEDMFEENFLTDDFNEHGDLTHRICGEDYGRATGVKSLNEAHLFQQEKGIDLSMGESLEFHEPSDLYSYLMKTDDGQDDEEYDSYKEVVNYPLENSTICGYIIDNITEDPIEGARVIIFWSGNRGIDVNYTYSDSLGFYSINIEISVPLIVVRASGYFSEFISISNIEDNETLWFNVSLDPGAPPENSVICGYITDNVTDDPIDGADIIQVDYDALMYYDWNYTCTNSSGFYSVNIAAGDILLYSDADGYYGNSVANYDISENETVWINLSLVPLPPENSTVCGYITDNVTENPIENANVVLGWYGDQGHYYQNYTFTNSSGFYSMSVAAGTIYLYVYADGYFTGYTDNYDIGEYETLQIDVSLYPRPPENSVVHGYVTDEETGDPIEDAFVSLDWRDEHGHRGWNYTYTNSSGFYSMSVAVGEFDLYISADRYFSESTGYYNFDIGENETMWVNISLEPYPPENSVVCGYVTDVSTGGPIEGARINLYIEVPGNSGPGGDGDGDGDDNGHTYQNHTTTNSSGYYSMSVAAGEIHLYVYADEYYSESTDRYQIDENETLWVNVSLYPRLPENSIVCGFINNLLTGDFIENAYVSLDWRDEHGHHDWNYTFSDSSGYYSMNVAAGEIDLYAGASGYFGEHTGDYDIGENETLWINISLYPRPPENSVVHGYVTDEETGDPIEDAYVDLDWQDDQGRSYGNYTYTNSSGYYSMNVAAGEIDLYAGASGYFGEHTGDYDIGENETLWINISLYPRPPENSVVHGYVTDEETGDPIEDAYVDLDWQDDQGRSYGNYTYTNSSGYYSMSVAAGEIDLYARADGYFTGYTDDYNIDEYETLQIDISMQFIINENSVVCGYVTDVETDHPITDAYVSHHWCDNKGHSCWNYTFSDSSGFYSMSVAAGALYIHAYAYGYLCEYTQDYEIGEYETLWVNVSMECEIIEVDIIKPQKALYIANHRVLPLLFKSVIYGSIDIEVDASDGTTFVEFSIDGKIKATDDSEPYIWTWDAKTLLKHRHTIKVVAYGKFGGSASDEIAVWKFF